MQLIQLPLPLLLMATVLLMRLASSCCVVRGQSTEAFEVTGYLRGADFLVNYSFVAIGEYDVTGPPAGTFGAAYILTSVSGTRTFTNTTTGSSEVGSLTLLPAGSYGNSDNDLYPYTVTVFNDHVLCDGAGLTFNLSTPELLAGDTTAYTVVNLYGIIIGPYYQELTSFGNIEHGILDAFFSTNVSGVATLPSSSSSTGPPSPIEIVVITVQGYLLGSDFVSNYNFDVMAEYASGEYPHTSYTALYVVSGVRIFLNLTTQLTEYANLTLLPPQTLSDNDNLLFPYFAADPPDATYYDALFDFEGLSFQLSSAEQVAGFPSNFTQVNLFFESMYGNFYSEEGGTGTGVGTEQEASIEQCFTAIINGTITGSHCATLPVAASSSTGMVSPISSSSSSSSVPAPDLTTIDVLGYLFGVDYTITYSFDGLAQLIEGSGPDTVYQMISATGTRVFTNTTSQVALSAALAILPAGSFGDNSNYLYPYYVNSTAIDYSNSTAAQTAHALFDEDGVSFSLSPPEEVDGGRIPTSEVNLYWSGAFYTETIEAPIGGYFLASIIGSPHSSSSTGLPAAPTGLSFSSATAPISVLGDPQFVGLRGQHFQVHGMDGEVYNLIVDRENSGSGSESESSSANGSTNDGAASGAGVMLVNARFRFLTSGRCPAISEPTNCWSHPGSYLSEVGVVSAAGSRLHVVSGDWSVGFSAVTLDGAPLLVGSAVSVNGLSVHVKSSYELSVSIGNFELTLDNSDRFINIAQVRVHHWSALSSHGLLGQTWRIPSKGRANSQLKCIEGDVDDYVEKSGDLFGSDLVYGAATSE